MADKKRILIVDDDENICRTLGDVLELEGYEVTKATDGFKALKAAEAVKFHSVLMDIKMPVMDGVETLQKLKGLSPGTPVIMVSAYAMDDLLVRAMEEGAMAVLKKPIDFDRLFELIGPPH